MLNRTTNTNPHTYAEKFMIPTAEIKPIELEMRNTVIKETLFSDMNTPLQPTIKQPRFLTTQNSGTYLHVQNLNESQELKFQDQSQSRTIVAPREEKIGSKYCKIMALKNN